MNVAAQTSLSQPQKTRRDPRLDFFRGLGMFIIFVAHLPFNWWTLWIPARFGFSDATEIFVFCSGMASAIAFGRIFDTHGLVMGTGRILHRMWQVYWSHIGLFLAIAALLVMLVDTGFLAALGNDVDYVGELNLRHFFEHTELSLPHLMTLTYVPNLFDILPMYIVILGLVPVVMAASRAGRGTVALLVIGLWTLATFGFLSLEAEPWSERVWFFNPFAWQMIFFTGFAFMRGWLPRPPVKTSLMVLAALIVVATIPFAWFRVINLSPEIREIRDAIEPLWIKTEFGILRFVHFLALAYLAWIAAGEGGIRLSRGPELWQGFVRVVQKVGQQSLAVFMMSLFAGQLVAILRDTIGERETFMWQAFANLLGFAILIATAYSVAWFKSNPWRKPVAKVIPDPNRP